MYYDVLVCMIVQPAARTVLSSYYFLTQEEQEVPINYSDHQGNLQIYYLNIFKYIIFLEKNDK